MAADEIFAPDRSSCSERTAPPPVIPSLQELCVAFIAKNLHRFPSLATLPWHLADLVVCSLPLFQFNRKN
jgi:hypothetical protein